jgi:hypothetical protein
MFASAPSGPPPVEEYAGGTVIADSSSVRWGDDRLPWLPAALRVALCDIDLTADLAHLAELAKVAPERPVRGMHLDVLFWRRCPATPDACRRTMTATVRRYWGVLAAVEVRVGDAVHTLAGIAERAGLEDALDVWVLADVGLDASLRALLEEESVDVFIDRGRDGEDRRIDGLVDVPPDLDGQLDDLLDRFVKTEWRGAMAARFGWDGGAPRTLDHCAAMRGVSRERVRQVEAVFTRHVELLRVPAVVDALELLEKVTDELVEQFAQRLAEAGISTRGIHPASLRALADLLDLDCPPFELYWAGDGERVAAVDSGHVTMRVRSSIRKLATSHGAALVRRVVEDIDDEHVDEDVVSNTIAHLRGCAVVDGWVVMDGVPRNRLDRQIGRMLLVSDRLLTDDVVEGLRREFRGRGLDDIPPPSVVKTWAARSSWVELKDERLHTRHAPPLASLDPTDRAVIDCFDNALGGVLSRTDLVDGLISRGVNKSTAVAVTSFSPILENVATGIWGLRGRAHDPAQVAAIRERRRAQQKTAPRPRVFWNADQRLVVVRSLTASMCSSGSMPIPADALRFLGRDRYAVVCEGLADGEIGVNAGGSSWGWGAVIAHLEVAAGDVLVAEFDIADGAAHIRLGEVRELEA